MTKRQWLNILLVLMLALVVGCGGEEANNETAINETEEPAAETEEQAVETEEQEAEVGTSADDTTATLVLYDYGDTNDRAIREEAIARFSERYPNVTVELQFTPISTWSEYLEKLVTQVAGGSPPDLVHIATEGVRLAADRELLMPLNDYVENDPDGQALLDDVAPALTDSFTVDGQLYLMPAAWNNMMIYYNTRVFEEAGIERPADDWTWDDFLDIAQQLTTGEGESKTYGYGIPYFNFGIHPWFLSNDAPLMNNDLTESNLNDPNVVEAAQFLHDLVHVYGVSPDPFSTDPNAVYQQFSTGKIGMTGGGHWPMQFFMSNNFEDYDVVPWPQNKAQATVFGADGYGIFADTENPDLAWELIKELTSVETMMQTVDAGVAIPARRSVAEVEEFLAQPEHAELFYQSLDYARPVTAPANFNELESIFMRHMDRLMADETTAEEAMSAAHEEFSATLD